MDFELADITHKIMVRLWRGSIDGGKIKGKKVLLKVDLKIERLLQDMESSPTLSKAVDSQDSLRGVEKLAYLKDVAKDSPAKHVKEGLWRMTGSYTEVLDLQERYDRPRLIHQAHIRAIVEAPSLNSGSGQELCHYMM